MVRHFSSLNGDSAGTAGRTYYLLIMGMSIFKNLVVWLLVFVGLVVVVVDIEEVVLIDCKLAA